MPENNSGPGKIFVMGDVHGAHKAMVQCLDRSEFDYQNDGLIFLGDVADGWSEVPECIEEFRKIRLRVILKGNHDVWFEKFLRYGEEPEHWLVQGGMITVRAYRDKPHLLMSHLTFMESALPYYLDPDNRLFVHAGFNPDKPVDQTDNPAEDYFWTREVYKRSFVAPVMPELYQEIYIGHTPTRNLSAIPLKNNNVWLMDQGAAWDGRLSMLNVRTKEFFQSDPVKVLYPDEPGRAGLLGLSF